MVGTGQNFAVYSSIPIALHTVQCRQGRFALLNKGRKHGDKPAFILACYKLNERFAGIELLTSTVVVASSCYPPRN
jgi:hypothetical protein